MNNLIEAISPYAKWLWIVIVAYVSPVQSIIILMGFLLFGDLVTGIWSAKRRGQRISSKRMSDTITKMVLYTLLILLTHGVESVFTALEYLHMTQIASSVMCIVELKSVYENVSEIVGDDLWRLIRDKVGAFKDIGVSEDTERKE